MVDKTTIEKSPPQRFYKYRDWNKPDHQKTLRFNSIYFTSPAQLNDPFDCALSIRYDKLTPKKILAIYKKYIKKLNSEYNIQEINGQATELVNNPHFYLEICKDAIRRNRDTTNNNAGIFSVSEINNDVLMWSHYCCSHTGLCIGFDVNKLFVFLSDYFKESTTSFACVPIKYKSKYPVFTLQSLNNKAINILATKAKYWRYEKEWRCIIWGETSKSVTLPEGIIKEVIIGHQMPESQKNEIIQILKNKQFKIELKEAHPNSEEFKLDINTINY